MVSVVVVGLVFIVFVVVGIIFLWSVLSWRIPVVVLRYTGNKERPTLIVRRGRKVIRRGVPYLYIKGYKTAIRDYHAENYYPSPKTRYGGVVLWEFEDGWLTPCVPKLEGLSAAERARVDQAFVDMQVLAGVKFEFNPDMHKRLKLKIIDDVDAEFFLEQQRRQSSQYSGGFLEWLDHHATSVLAVIIVGFVLAGFIVYLQKMPEMNAACVAAAKDTLVSMARDFVTNPPPG